MTMHVRRIAIVAAFAALMTTSVDAQWIHYPTPGMPRTPDGKPNLAAPAPKTADGKPDLSGTWLTQGIYIGDIAKDLKEPVPFQPWAADLYKHRRDNLGTEDPTGWCVVGACRDRPRCRIRSRF